MKAKQKKQRKRKKTKFRVACPGTEFDLPCFQVLDLFILGLNHFFQIIELGAFVQFFAHLLLQELIVLLQQRNLILFNVDSFGVNA